MRRNDGCEDVEGGSALDAPWWVTLSTRARRYGRRFAVDPEDLVQGTAAAYLARRSPVAAAAPWLERVLRNRAVDAWRLRQRETPWTPPASEAAPGPSALEQLVERERRERVTAACQSLTAAERALLARRFTDTAQAPPLSPGDRTRLRRLLLRLRRELRDLRALALPGWAFSHGTATLVAMTPLLLAVTLGTTTAGDAAMHLAQRGRAASPSMRAQTARVVPPSSTGRIAADADRHPEVREEARAAPRRFDFDDDRIEGALQAPDEIVVEAAPSSRKASLIELRHDFLPELLKGLEDLD